MQFLLHTIFKTRSYLQSFFKNIKKYKNIKLLSSFIGSNAYENISILKYILIL